MIFFLLLPFSDLKTILVNFNSEAFLERSSTIYFSGKENNAKRTL
jgi:hypothetical protein